MNDSGRGKVRWRPLLVAPRPFLPSFCSNSTLPAPSCQAGTAFPSSSFN